MSAFTDFDQLVLDSMGITVPAQRTRRSSWTPERVLQEACDGNVTGEVVARHAGDVVERRIYIDGRAADQSECDAVGDLLATGQLAIVGVRVVLTSEGRSTLATWARYAPIGRKRGEQ